MAELTAAGRRIAPPVRASRRPAADRGSAWALEPAGDLTRLVCHKASYGMAPDPVHLAADGVTWRATWEPRPEADGGKVNGAGKVAADVDTSEA